MNKLLERTLRLAGVDVEVLIEQVKVIAEEKKDDEPEAVDDEALDVPEGDDEKKEEKKEEKEDKKDDEEKEEKEEEPASGDTASYVASTYSELRQLTWEFVDTLFDEIAEEFGDEVANIFIDNKSEEEELKPMADKFEDVKKFVDDKMSGAEKGKEPKEEKKDGEEKKEGEPADDFEDNLDDIIADLK